MHIGLNSGASSIAQAFHDNDAAPNTATVLYSGWTNGARTFNGSLTYYAF